MKGATQGSQMFKETIYLNLKGFHTGDVLEQFSDRYKHIKKIINVRMQYSFTSHQSWI